MNGRELLEALSYIDEELLDVAQAPMKRASSRRWIALAACLCILVLGVYSIRQMNMNQKTAGTDDHRAPEAMMAMGTGQETYAAMESAAKEPMDAAPEEGEPYNALCDTDEVTSEAEPILVMLIELTDGGFIAQVVGAEDPLTVTVLFTEGIRLPPLTEGEEYYVTVVSTEEDGTLWASAVEPALEG